MKILRNAIECLKCHETIVSGHVHDFRYCSCKAVAVDGGPEYLRRLGNQHDYIEACAYEAATAKEGDDLDGKWLVYSPTGRSNPSVAFDRQEDAVASAKIMAERTRTKLWYVTLISSVLVP